MNLTALIPAYNESENLELLLPKVKQFLEDISPNSWEILIVDGGSQDNTNSVAEKWGVRIVLQRSPGYGGAIRTGIEDAHGDYILTMDADLSHDPSFIYKLWENRHFADIIIASRYCKGGVAYMPWTRKILSRILNAFFARGLSLPVRDLSSGFRLYRASLLKKLELSCRNFDVLEEILIKAHIEGWKVAEIPFTYFPRQIGSSNARVFKFGIDYLRAFFRMWAIRNSIEAADYEERAFYSLILPKRYLQRCRHKYITTVARTQNLTIDVGCGSSVILQSLNHVIGVDIRFPKLRYVGRYHIPLVNASVFRLPFRDAVADCVICSEVTDRISKDPNVFIELDRVLKPGGVLILGVTDYGNGVWPTIERVYRFLIPGACAGEPISHYSHDDLSRILSALGHEILDHKYILKSKLIMVSRRGLIPVESSATSPLMTNGAIHS